MPIHCPVQMKPLDAATFEALDYRIMGHAYASQNELGRLCDECAYQADLKARLDKLTDQLQKRRDAKEQIVKLRVQVLVNEAQGLGFYPEGTSAWPAMGYGQMYERLYGVPAYPATTPPPVSR